MRFIKLLLFVISISPLFSDTFTLKNGNRFYGKQIERTDTFIVYRDSSGNIQTINVNDIQSVESNDLVTAPANDPQPANSPNTVTTQPNSSSQPSTNTTPVTKTAPTSGDKSTANNLPAGEDEASMELTTEIVSDFVWRGNSYGGEYLSRRNNTQYKSVNEYWALQPNLRINAPIKGLYMELWGNFPLVGRKDRDSDMRLLQTHPGGPEIDPNSFISKQGQIASDPATYNYNNTGFFYDPFLNINNNKCSADSTLGCSNPDQSFIDPRSVGQRKEKNGMARTDGVFTTFAYTFQNKKFGEITWGMWFYYQLDKNSKYSWDEYFIFWGLPFLERYIKPTIQLYTQSSFDFGSIYAGGHYASFSVSHTFFEDQFFRIQPISSLGYKYINNNIDQKSGFYDWTNNLRFFFGDFFFSLNNAYRPNLYMYDNDQFYFPLSQGSAYQTGGNQYDGKTVDPSKLYGPVNKAVYDAIDRLDTYSAVKNTLKEEYQSQKIVQNLFWISFGLVKKF